MVDLAKYLQEGETPLGVYTDEGNVVHWSNIIVTDRRVLIYECTPPSPGELRTIDLKDIIDVHCRKKAMSAIIEIRTEKKVFKVYDLTRDAGDDAKEHIKQAAEEAQSQVPETITLPDGRVVQVVLHEPGAPQAVTPDQASTYQYPQQQQQVPQEQSPQEQQPQQDQQQWTQPQEVQQAQQQWPQPQEVQQVQQEWPQPQQDQQVQQQWTQPQEVQQAQQQWPQQPPPEPELVGQRMREDGTMEDMSPEEAKALAEEAEKAFKDLEDLDV
ncbi:MAG: hypothetical protein QGG26_16665 [Candidatus Undinarchaeales archaeon]|jgi:hypothetical protein|nr:hypothetical protein [Candidatus Undinarchaeales archaeon]